MVAAADSFFDIFVVEFWKKLWFLKNAPEKLEETRKQQPKKTSSLSQFGIMDHYLTVFFRLASRNPRNPVIFSDDD